MRRFSLACAVVLAGCAGDPLGLEPLLNNRFVEIQAQPLPQGMAGTWTGAIGPYHMTYVLKGDGTGVVCQAWHKHNSVVAVKYADGEIHAANGGSVPAQLEGDALIVTLNERPANMPPSHRFVRDDGLHEAAPYCRKELS